MKSIRYILEALLLGILLLLAKMLPVQWASALGGWLGRTIGPKLAASRKAENNIRASLTALSETEIKKTVAGMWENLGRVMMEYPHLKHIGRQRTEIVGLEILEKYKQQSTLLFSGHLANWEVCPPALLLKGNFPAMPIYRAPNNPFSDKLLKWARSMGGKLKTIPKSKTGTRQLVKALQEGAHIGMLIDQKYNEGIEADFMGRPAMTSPVYAQLAQKFDIPLIPLRIERTEGPNFRVTVFPPLETRNKNIEEIIDESHKLLGNWIKEKPEQWLWLHRRWDSKKLKENNDA